MSAEPDAARVLVVDDDPDMRALLERWLTGAGHRVETAGDGRAALARMALAHPDLVLTDLVMDDMDGLRLLREVHRLDAVLPVVILSGQAGVGDAVRAAHLGVSAFLDKEAGREAVLEAVRSALAGARARRAAAGDFAPEIVRKSEVMAALLRRASLVAATESTVLVGGATGTGKELLARAIHDASPRRERAFVTVNCSAIPEQLLESELFGHEKGAFTGATARHPGLFQAAHRGTLFLDEIGDMPLGLQAKLLRVLQDFEVRPVGAVKTVPVDVRLVCATHRDLEREVAEGRFREDLFYRISVVPLEIPPLAERREDIPLIVDRILDRLAAREGGRRKRLAPKAYERLARAAWPGNVRQLANVVERCWVLSPGEVIGLDTVEGAVRGGEGAIQTLEEARHAFERRYLVGVLRIANGNVSTAARLAGRNRTEFYKLLSRHELDPAAFRARD